MRLPEALLRTLTLAMLLSTAPAMAAEPLIDGGVEEAWEALRALPPSFSWDFQMGSGYTDVPALRQYSNASLGMGGRFGFGKHLDNPTHRLGGSLALSIDGPVPITFAFVVEPAAGWDAIFRRVLVGAGAGVAMSYNMNNDLVGWDTSLTAGPSFTVRLGYSEPWSRVGRRFHAFVEPRVRYMSELWSPGVMLYVGSGVGR